MKKILLTILAFFIGINIINAEIILPEVTDHEKVTMYLFISKTCEFCHTTVEAVNNYEDKYSEYFEVKAFDIDKADNIDLFNHFNELYNLNYSYPLILIGDEYHQVGYNEKMLEEALKAYEDQDYKDIVKPEYEDNDSYIIMNLEETTEYLNIPYYGNTNYNAIIALVVFAVIIGGAVILLIPRKK